MEILKTRPIDVSGAKELYAHMKRDFPPGELPPHYAVKGNIGKGIYDAFYFLDDHSEVTGYAVVTAPNDMAFALLNFFAVMPHLRGKGVGSAALNTIAAMYPGRVIMLEADDPSHARNDSTRSEAERRIAFYERAGYYVVKTSKAHIFGVPMVIMASGDLRGESARSVMRALYADALSSERWLFFIDVRD